MEQEKNIFLTFFKKLSERQNYENHLSDVTWAMCETSKDFKFLFLSFFFGGDAYKNYVPEFRKVKIEREYLRRESRPDFYFKIKEKEFIIENKIDDLDDHFDKYKRDFEGAFFGWIANYRKDKEDEIEIRTWGEFKEFLECEKKNMPEATNLLIESYLTYLTNVCKIIKIEKMNLENISTLYSFNNLTNKIIRNENLKTLCDRFGSYYSGWQFTTRKTITAPAWFGIIYDEQQIAIISIWVTLSSTDIKISGGIWFDEPIISNERDNILNGEILKFNLNKKSFEEFTKDETSVDNQKKILESFFKEVNDKLSKAAEKIPE
ncbi:MAG: hypothetical protein ABI199_04420 [Bacteroidia bacterium]